MIVSFFGGDSKCGTSQIALCVAKRLAELEPSARVLFAEAVFGLPNEYSENALSCIDDIKPYLDRGLFDAENIFGNESSDGNLYVLGGTGNTEVLGSIRAEAAADFLKRAEMSFDYIICDCGSRLDNGLSVGAIAASDMLNIVLTQSELCLKRLCAKTDILDRLAAFRNAFYINRYNTDSPYDADYIAKRLGINAAAVRRLPESRFGERAEMQGLPLICFKDRRFKKSIDAAASEIAARNG